MARGGLELPGACWGWIVAPSGFGFGWLLRGGCVLFGCLTGHPFLHIYMLEVGSPLSLSAWKLSRCLCTHTATLVMISIVKSVAASSNLNTSLACACLLKISVNCSTSSTIPGTRVLRCETAKPGLKIRRHVDHSEPSDETRLLADPQIRAIMSLTATCFGRDSLTVIWCVMSGSTILDCGFRCEFAVVRVGRGWWCVDDYLHE